MIVHRKGVQWKFFSWITNWESDILVKLKNWTRLLHYDLQENALESSNIKSPSKGLHKLKKLESTPNWANGVYRDSCIKIINFSM